MLSTRILGLAGAVAVFVCLTAATVSAQRVEPASQLPLLATIGTMTLMSAAVLRQSRRRKR